MADGADEPQRVVVPSGGPRWAVIGIFLLLTFYAIAYARAFLMPVVLGLMLALVFSPVRRWMERRSVAPGFGATIIVTTLVAGFLAVVVTLAAPATALVDDAPRIMQEVERKISGLRRAAEDVAEVAAQVDQVATGGGAAAAEVDAAAAAGEEEPERVVVEDRGAAMTVALTAPTVLAQIVLTLVLLFFLLASGDMFYEKIVHVIPRFADKRRAIQIARDVERRLSRYLLTITVINAGLGAAIGIAMWAIGMPTPLLFAVIGFVFNFVPYIGAVAGVIVATAVGLVSLDTVGMALATGAIYFGLTSIECQFVTPYFVGRSLRLNVVVVFLSVTLWAWLWSVVGMLVATPVLVAVRTLCEHIPSLGPLGDFLSGRGEEREAPSEEAPPRAAE
jgi:predicted PurR-regulated permease PerM